MWEVLCVFCHTKELNGGHVTMEYVCVVSPLRGELTNVADRARRNFCSDPSLESTPMEPFPCFSSG